MEQSEAARVLGRILREFLPPGEPVFRVIQENVYHLAVGEQAYLIKWVPMSDSAGQNELRVGRLLKDRAAVPAPPLLFEKHVTGGTIAGWAWVDGKDLRTQQRERLPDAFALLGRLHRALRNSGPVVTPFSDPHNANPRYDTIHAMLAAETFRLAATFSPRVREQCASIITRLGVGYPTLVHGDMHPGNILLSAGQIWFVDWSYACNSLNLLDLDYIHSLPLPDGESTWWVIHPHEAAPVLAAYCQAAGLEGLDIAAMHQAVMVWNLLRTHENSIKNGYRAEVETVTKQLMAVLDR